MITPEELRKGNLLQDDLGRVVTVLWFDNSGVEADHARYQFEEMFPIPITVEWLERFGGVKRNSGVYGFLNQENEYRVLVWPTGETEIYLYGYDFSIKYIHELQNWHYVWMKEELEYV